MSDNPTDEQIKREIMEIIRLLDALGVQFQPYDMRGLGVEDEYGGAIYEASPSCRLH